MSKAPVTPVRDAAALGPYALAVDAMGGDRAPDIVLAGLELAADRHPTARLLLIGDEAVLKPALARYPKRR